MKKTLTGFTIAVFSLCAVFIGVLLLGALERFTDSGESEQRSITQVIIPQAAIGGVPVVNTVVSVEERITPIALLGSGEIAVSILNLGYDASEAREQVVAFRRSSDTDGQVYISLVGFDSAQGRYRQFWSQPTAVTQGNTVSIFSVDILGDRTNSIVVTGMNGSNEHTMTVFRDARSIGINGPFAKIAELYADSPIFINETGRSAAFHQGTANGASFTITAYRRDAQSANIMDQVRTVYAFSPPSGQFQTASVTRLPGAQIEQQRVRDLLSGRHGVFEEFIHGLWYYDPAGGGEAAQFMYFDTVRREIIFMCDNNQQSFAWQRSSPTRYGLYVVSQSNSIESLRRFINIELESLDNIRLRVHEPVSFRIMVDSSWNGSYRRAAREAEERAAPIHPDINAVFDGPWGRLSFFDSGYYTISSGGIVERGRYLFFTVNGYSLLEMRPENENGDNGARVGAGNGSRKVFKVEPLGPTGVMLTSVRIGASGISSFQEAPVHLTFVGGYGGLPAVVFRR